MEIFYELFFQHNYFFLIFINFAHAENLLKIGISDDNSYPYYFKQAARFQGDGVYIGD